VNGAVKGDISDPVAGEGGGMYIGAVCDIRSANIYQDANPALRDSVRGQVFARKLDLRAKEYMRSLREKATINMN
jgi:hypothetical protein